MCKDRFRAMNKPRQCGISTTAAAEAAWEFDNVPGAQIVIVSKDKDAAVNFHKYIYNVLYSVRDNWAAAPVLLKTNERETTNSIGSRVVSLAASKETGRSFSATHFYFDEMAFAEYADDIFQASTPMLSQTNGRMTVISTPKGRANLFAQLFERPEDFGFTLFNFKWWDVPTYNPYYAEYMAAKRAGNVKDENKFIELGRTGKWYKDVRRKYTDLAWQNEFEGSFDADEGAVFSTRQIERTFYKNWLEEATDDLGLCSEYFATEPIEGHEYVTGVDLGRKRDPTVLITYDVTLEPATIVEFKYIPAGAADYVNIERSIRETHEKYNESEVQLDATGAGDPVHQLLEDISIGFLFTNSKKTNIIEKVRLAMDNGALRMPKLKHLYSEHQKYTWQDKFMRQDTVMANALAVDLFYDPEDVYTGVDAVNYVGDVAWQ